MAHAAAARRRVAADARHLKARRDAQPKTSTNPAPFVGPMPRAAGARRIPRPGRCARAWCGRSVRTAGAHRHKTYLRRSASSVQTLLRRRTSNGACSAPRFVVEPEHNTLILLDRHDQRAQRREDVVAVALAEAPVALVREARLSTISQKLGHGAPGTPRASRANPPRGPETRARRRRRGRPSRRLRAGGRRTVMRHGGVGWLSSRRWRKNGPQLECCRAAVLPELTHDDALLSAAQPYQP